jgi:hypothetical protein
MNCLNAYLKLGLSKLSVMTLVKMACSYGVSSSFGSPLSKSGLWILRYASIFENWPWVCKLSDWHCHYFILSTKLSDSNSIESSLLEGG